MEAWGKIFICLQAPEPFPNNTAQVLVSSHRAGKACVEGPCIGVLVQGSCQAGMPLAELCNLFCI